MSTSEQPIDSRHKGRHRAGSVQEAGRIGSGLVTMVHDGSLFYVQLFVGHHTRDKKCPDSAVSVLGEGSRMVPSPMPKRDHSDPQTFRPRSEGEGKLVRAEGLEPSRTLRSNGFSCHYGFRRPRLIAARFGVWTIPSPCPKSVSGLGAARLVSTP